MDRRLRHLFGTFIATAALLAFLAPTAAAVDPECDGLVGEPPVFTGCQWKLPTRTATVRFCTPQVDVDGDDLPASSLKDCTVTLDGNPFTVPLTEPGTVFSVIMSGKHNGHTVEAFCTSFDDVQGEVWVSPVCFPSGQGRGPHKID
jgi:hypothetical protein